MCESIWPPSKYNKGPVNGLENKIYLNKLAIRQNWVEWIMYPADKFVPACWNIYAPDKGRRNKDTNAMAKAKSHGQVWNAGKTKHLQRSDTDTFVSRAGIWFHDSPIPISVMFWPNSSPFSPLALRVFDPRFNVTFIVLPPFVVSFGIQFNVCLELRVCIFLRRLWTLTVALCERRTSTSTSAIGQLFGPTANWRWPRKRP